MYITYINSISKLFNQLFYLQIIFNDNLNDWLILLFTKMIKSVIWGIKIFSCFEKQIYSFQNYWILN